MGVAQADISADEHQENGSIGGPQYPSRNAFHPVQSQGDNFGRVLTRVSNLINGATSPSGVPSSHSSLEKPLVKCYKDLDGSAQSFAGHRVLVPNVPSQIIENKRY